MSTWWAAVVGYFWRPELPWALGITLGMDLSSLVATSAVITAVVAFSMHDTLGNTLGGLLLQLESSINLGDWVTVSGVSGRIVEIRWRYTAIETRDGDKYFNRIAYRI